jgi:hypothetical protein
MSKVPSLSYEKVINALRRNGWVVNLAHILKQANLSLEAFLDLL